MTCLLMGDPFFLFAPNGRLAPFFYQYFAATFSFPSRVAHDGMRIVIAMIAQRTPGAKLETNVDKYVDERLLDELEREGLFKRISGKG